MRTAVARMLLALMLALGACNGEGLPQGPKDAAGDLVCLDAPCCLATGVACSFDRQCCGWRERPTHATCAERCCYLDVDAWTCPGG